MTYLERHLVLPFLTVFAVVYFLTGYFNVAFIVVLSLLVLLASLRLDPPSAEVVATFFQPHEALVIAHRGGALDAPENTLAAVSLAKKNGAKAVEFDISFTKDGYAVAFHDETLERTTDGTGNISDKTLEQLRGLNASCKHPNSGSFPNERIPTVEEFVQLCLRNDLRIVFDCKSDARKTVDLIIDLYKRHPKLYHSAIVCSFFPWIVYLVRKRDRNIIGGLTHRTTFLTTRQPLRPYWMRLLVLPLVDVLLKWSQYSWLWYLCGNSFFLAHYPDVSLSVVDHFKERGVQVMPWTPNTTSEKRFFVNSLRCPVISDTMLNKDDDE